VQERERDAAGRARNARPRDRHGRPLPRGAVGVGRMPDDLALDPDDAVAEAQRLLDAGLPFNAHDVLEGVWKAAPAAERELWRALAQVAVGLTHAQRGNARGAVALLNRAADGIGRWVGPAPAALDLDGVRTQAEELAGRIERAGVAGLTDCDLHVRLRG
jgi:hypothetical protein